uniref:EF-hand domain-containing protein n=1 Tax=Entomoneis paludosa TaxID=265537 RepID=A0A7S2YU31_9STRA|mmetsp:Transcript_9938/g.20546  ORF Transcript_9938/g.20546 Transcript_9938/m.20546 type:complete len:266 (+) Transcript_9938:65-862(+)
MAIFGDSSMIGGAAALIAAILLGPRKEILDQIAEEKDLKITAEAPFHRPLTCPPPLLFQQSPLATIDEPETARIRAPTEDSKNGPSLRNKNTLSPEQKLRQDLEDQMVQSREDEIAASCGTFDEFQVEAFHTLAANLETDQGARVFYIEDWLSEICRDNQIKSLRGDHDLEKFDLNEDGFITMGEIGQALTSNPFSIMMQQIIVCNYSSAENDCVTADDIVAFGETLFASKGILNKDLAKQIIREMDKNEDGRVCSFEIVPQNRQ